MEGLPDSDDEALSLEASGSISEFRRLKRICLAKKQKRLVFTKTPTPESFLRDPTPNVEMFTEINIDNKLASFFDNHNLSIKGEKKSVISGKSNREIRNSFVIGPDPFLCDIDFWELELFRGFISERKEILTVLQKIVMKQIKSEDKKADMSFDDSNSLIGTANSYGLHLKPGEGAAMAAFIKSDKRIPRRGEVGLTADQIATFEKIGYVMSGSRHARMNAIRMRKENQVYTAEEKAALALINFEEKKAKELRVLEDLKRLIDSCMDK